MVYGHFLGEKSPGKFPFKTEKRREVPELISYVLERAGGGRAGDGRGVKPTFILIPALLGADG